MNKNDERMHQLLLCFANLASLKNDFTPSSTSTCTYISYLSFRNDNMNIFFLYVQASVYIYIYIYLVNECDENFNYTRSNSDSFLLLKIS